MDNEEFRRHAHAFVDWMADYLRDVERYPVRAQTKPGEIAAQLPTAPPERAETMDAIFADFQSLVMPGITHTFKKAHRIMVQIQSTWFPLVARNPQKFMANYKLGTDTDFQKATERVYHSPQYPSRIVLPVLKK